MNKANRVMAVARVNKKDEFYTRMKTIETEIKHYKKQLENKIIYCNCDDPEVSNFFKYFVKEFHNLKLKKVIASCYVKQDYNLFNMKEKQSKAKYSTYQGEIDGPKVKYLNGDGDFRSKESIEFLKETDIVITNPPFSLFKEYVNCLIKYNKEFLIVGNTNAVTYKDFFMLLKNNQVKPSYTFNKSIEFQIPNEYEVWDRIDDLNNKYATVPAITWWTNLEKHNNKHMQLTEVYDENKYIKYFNYDAINVKKVTDIPNNYYGIMGVPITFIGQWNPEQFELIGLGAGIMYKKLGGKVIGQKFLEEYLEHGGTGNYVANQYVLGYYDSQGRPNIPYMRLLIRRKDEDSRHLELKLLRWVFLSE